MGAARCRGGGGRDAARSVGGRRHGVDAFEEVLRVLEHLGGKRHEALLAGEVSRRARARPKVSSLGCQQTNKTEGFVRLRGTVTFEFQALLTGFFENLAVFL